MTSILHRQFIALSQSPGASAKNHRQNTPAASAIIPGTNTAAILSASRCTGAFELCARCTSSIICCRTESLPSRVAASFTLPERLSVPPSSSSPSDLSTGRLSPVSSDSSTAQRPSIITPSTGMRSPGRMMTTSCSSISSMLSSFSSPPRCTSAVFGLSRMRRRIACELSPMASCSR